MKEHLGVVGRNIIKSCVDLLIFIKGVILGSYAYEFSNEFRYYYDIRKQFEKNIDTWKNVLSWLKKAVEKKDE